MTEQLSLFQTPGQRPAEDDADALPGIETGAIDELFSAAPRWRSSRQVLALLDFIARFPGYSPLNGFLLSLQDPDATFVATRKAWLRRYERRLKPRARPLVILAPMSPVLFVFDIRDTEGPALTAGALQPAAAAGRLSPKVHENTLHNCRIQSIAVRRGAPLGETAERAVRITPAIQKRLPGPPLEAGGRYGVLLEEGLPLEDTYGCLVEELAHIFCGHLGIDGDAWWAERKDLDLERIAIEADAVAYLVCRRRGLSATAERFLAECRRQDRHMPVFSLNAVFQAAHHIERMGKSPWRRLRKQGRR